MPDYAVTAEFYDLLQATEFLRTAEGLLDRWLGVPRVGVIDVGAGTGLATGILARRCNVTVHAVEPSPSMRAVLLSRLAGRPELLSKVRLHARTLQKLGLTDVADFAFCLNTMGMLAASERAAGLAALAKAVVRGGMLVVQRPPEHLDRDRYDLPQWSLGGDVYSGEVACTTVGPDRVRWLFTYRVTRSEAVIREAVETFDGYLVSPKRFAAELQAAGFGLLDADKPDVVVARRVA